MAVHHARVIALAAVLVGISALGSSTRLQAQQPLNEDFERRDLLVYFNAGSWQMSSKVLPSGSWKNSALALMVSKTVGRGFNPSPSNRSRSTS